jgi:heme-degrading monooxygenase HmoA
MRPIAPSGDGTTFYLDRKEYQSMFTRVVTITTKTGKARELSRTINDKVLPLLKSQQGFVDEIVLVSEQNPERMLAVSFWREKDDAERYNREGFPAVNEIIRNLIEGAPKVETFDLEQSTVHKVAAGRAA